jgi:hypothetical protein
MKKRLLSLLLALVMVVSLLPTFALAASGIVRVTDKDGNPVGDEYYMELADAVAGTSRKAGSTAA